MTLHFGKLRWAALASAMVLAGCNSSADGTGGPLFGFMASDADQLVTDVAEEAAAALGVSAPVDGDVAVVCGMSKSDLGKKVDAIPEKGRANYTLYDTRPGSSDQRDWYVTGFDDGCARRVTAALAMFGSVELYEMVRYSGLIEGGTAATDKAYDRVRRSACGNAKKPCTGNGLKTISRETAFLQAFPRKGSASHLEMLFHKGALAATATK